MTQSRPTAAQLVDRIKATLASSDVTWRTETVDTFKAGDPDTAVSGIATTFMATFDALQLAVAAGANFVITHEPTFYNHQDQTTALVDDAVYRAKAAFIADHRMVIFRFHDHWHARRPEAMRLALTRAMGWPQTPGVLTIPPTTLGALAADAARALKIHSMRVVGDAATPVSRVAIGVGYGNPQLNANVDAVLTGESQEADSAWDNAEYVIDAAFTGGPKGLILLGHERSERLGMDECATWLRTFISDVPVTFVEPGEPFTDIAQ